MIEAFKNKKILILCGGSSNESEISIRSAKNVQKALSNLTYNAQCKILDKTDTFDIQENCIYFNALHGGIGENGTLAHYLMKKNQLFTGASAAAASLSWNKIYFKKLLKELGVLTPDSYPADIHPDSLNYPIILKPTEGGSSINLFKINDSDSLREIQKQMKSQLHLFFIENFIEGQEATIGMLHNGETLLHLPTLEIYPKGEFYNYQSKYTPGETIFKFNHKLSIAAQEKCKWIANKVQAHLPIFGASRLDVIFDKEEKAYVLELNSSPGLTDTSDIPAQAKEAGFSQEKLMEHILETALCER